MYCQYSNFRFDDREDCSICGMGAHARHDPDASCEAYFSRAEWQPAYLVHTDGGELPTEPLTISAFMLMIAELGGWQRKKNQGSPGSMTIWRGLRRMEAYADAFQAFQKARLRCGG